MNSVNKSRIKIFVIAPFDDNGWRWLEKWFDHDRYQWVFYKCNLLSVSHKKIWIWLYHAFKAVRQIDSSYDIIITHGPWMALYVSIVIRTMGVPKKKFIAHTFNHGNKIFFSGPFLLLAKLFMLPVVDRYITFSNYECDIYSRMYGIPIQRLSFTHWAVANPRTLSKKIKYIDTNKRYICMIGRNNRDFKSFIKVAYTLPITSIIVCSKGQAHLVDDYNKKIILLNDLSLEECNTIIKNSVVNVILVQDGEVGAGHMTLVNAMLLGVPQVLSKVKTLEDYFIDGEHGFFVGIHDVDGIRIAINTIISDMDLQKRMRNNILSFAERWFTEEAACQALKRLIDSLYSDKIIIE